MKRVKVPENQEWADGIHSMEKPMPPVPPEKIGGATGQGQQSSDPGRRKSAGTLMKEPKRKGGD